jgi:MFS family permease
LVAGVGAFLAVIANPLFGRLSDRTTSRLGMRRPWLLGGSVTGVLGLLVIALSNTVPGILIGWCIAQVAFNATLAALTAVIADQVPSKQRGTVSGFVGIAQGVDILAGVAIAQIFTGQLFWIFFAPGLVGYGSYDVLLRQEKNRKR